MKTRRPRRGRDDAGTEETPQEMHRVLPKFTDLLKMARGRRVGGADSTDQVEKNGLGVGDNTPTGSPAGSVPGAWPRSGQDAIPETKARTAVKVRTVPNVQSGVRFNFGPNPQRKPGVDAAVQTGPELNERAEVEDVVLSRTDEADNMEVVTQPDERSDLGSFTPQQKQYLEISKLQREREADQKRLKELGSELVIANMQINRSVQQLAEAKLALEEQKKQQEKRTPQRSDQLTLKQPPHNRGVATMPSSVLATSREGKQAVITAFQKLRTTILKFAGSSAVQLSPLPANLVDVDNLLQPQEWNRASAEQRRYRIMAKIFQLLFRRIFRPGLRIFGVQAFLRSGISASEAHLRALEKDLEAKGGWLSLTPSYPLTVHTHA